MSHGLGDRATRSAFILAIVLTTANRAAEGPPASAAGPVITATKTASDGIRLTLRAPSGAVPIDALVRVTVQATNTSQHAIHLGVGLDQGCSLSTADAEVVAAQDTVAYPPTFPNAPLPECAPPGPDLGPTLQPGQTLTVHPYIILRAPYLRARLTLQSPQEIVTPRLLLHRTREAAPRVSLNNGPIVSALVRPRVHVHGPMLAQMWWRCLRPGASAGPALVTQERPPGTWQSLPSRRIVPVGAEGCTRITEWHVVAGWPGHRIAKIDVVRA